MAKVLMLNMAVLESLRPFLSSFWFEICFEGNEGLMDNLELKIIYVS